MYANFVIIIYHCAAVVSRGSAKASAYCFHIYLSCTIFCQMVSRVRLVRLSIVSPVFLGISYVGSRKGETPVP